MFTPVPAPQPQQFKKPVSNSLASIHISVASLPSKGKVYPDGANISYRPYTFGEIKKVSQSKLSEVDFIDFLLEGITLNFDPLILTVADLGFIGILRKLSSLGNSSGLYVNSKCSACSAENKKQLELNSLDFDELTVDFPIIWELTRDNGENYEFHFSPMTIGDFKVVLTKKKTEDVTALLAISCRNHPFEETYAIFESLSLGEADNLQKVEKYLIHGIKPVEITCACGKITTVRLEADQQLVLPFRGPQESVKSRIRFGMSSSS